MLWGSVTLAIDFHEDSYGKKKDNEGVVYRKPERGTSYTLRIATIESYLTVDFMKYRLLRGFIFIFNLKS